MVYSMQFVGSDLYVGGAFHTTGGISANNIARWNGSLWTPLGSGTDAPVYALTIYNNKLCVGGSFVNAGAKVSRSVATAAVEFPLPPPVITSATTASGTIGTSCSYQISASNTPSSFAASGLPSGLVVNATTGLVSGIPSASGTFLSTVSATNASGTDSVVVTFTIFPIPPVITSVNTATGLVGQPFSYSITATSTPASFACSGLPVGLSVDTATGIISGTPTAAGTSTVTVSATNAGGTGSATLTITIQVAAPAITSATTAAGQVGVPFSYAITASGTPTAFNATGLPAGLSVDTATGVISGTPTAAGSSTVTITATNAGGTATATLTITIQVAAPVLTSGLTATGQINAAFTYTITASGTPTAFNATGLPAGLSVNSTTGVISGTPTAAGTSTVTVSATNAGGTASGTLTIVIDPALPVISSATTATGTVGALFSFQIVASSQPSTYAATGLPAGLTVNSSSGLISGTPTIAGTSAVAVSATNGNGTGTGTLSITIQPAATVTVPVIPASPAAAFAAGGGGSSSKCGLGSGLGLLFGGLSVALWWRRRRT
jgi:PKD repeat protein